MKTAIYVDGYNLYYGRLKNTPYKWLNLHGLLEHIIREREPKSTIISCRYYTAMIKARLATHGDASVQAQNVYHRALKSPQMPYVECIPSNHTLDRKPLMRWIAGQPPSKKNRVDVWQTAEKQTDVRIALDAYRAACGKTVEQIVIVTNDTDLEPLIEALKHDFPRIRRGAIIPRQELSIRQPAQGFMDNCSWVRKHIRDEELARFQMPRSVIISKDKKPAVRPEHWNPECFFKQRTPTGTVFSSFDL